MRTMHLHIRQELRPARLTLPYCRTAVLQAEESGQLELSGLVRAAVRFRLEHKLLHLEVLKVRR